MQLKRAEKVLLALCVLSTVICLIGLLSPEWLVKVESSILPIPLKSVCLWTMNLDKYVGDVIVKRIDLMKLIA